MIPESHLPQQRFKAAMRVVADLVGSSSDEDILNDVRATGEDPAELAQDVTDLFEEVSSRFESKEVPEPPVQQTAGNFQLLQRIKAGGLLPPNQSFDVVLNCIVQAVRRLGIDRVRLYLLSDDEEDEQFLLAAAHWGMAADFIGQRRPVRNESHWDVLSRDFGLHVFQREPGEPPPFEQGIPEEMAVREWFCLLLTWNGKIVGKLSGDCKKSGRPLLHEDLRPIDFLAPLFGSAIGQARLLTNLASVLEVSSVAMSGGTPRKVMRRVCRALGKLPGNYHSSVLLVEADQLGYVEAEYPGLGARGTFIPLRGVALAERLTETRAPLIIADVPSELGLGPLRDILGKLEIRSALIVPVISSGRVVGALTLAAIKNIYKFTDVDIALATIYASQVGVAIENQLRRDESTERYQALVQLDQAVEDMLVADDFDKLAQLIANTAMKLFDARYTVFRLCKRDDCQREGQEVFTSGILVEDWMAVEQHESNRNRLVSAVRDEGWVEITNMWDENPILSGLQLGPDILCFQGVSLKIANELEGLLFLGYSRPDAFNAEQRQRARKFAAFAALSLQRIQAISGRKQSTGQPTDERLKAHLLAFYKTSKIITSASGGLKPTEILDEILKQAVECTRIGKDSLRNTLGTIALFDGTSNTLRLESAYPRGAPNNLPIGYTQPVLKQFGRIGVTGRAVIDKKPQRVSNVLDNKDYIARDPSTLSELAVPILEGDTSLGVLNVESDKEDAFDQLDEDTVTALARLAAIAIQNAREHYLLAPALQV
jgi:GAF domain-containing protein